MAASPSTTNLMRAAAAKAKASAAARSETEAAHREIEHYTAHTCYRSSNSSRITGGIVSGGGCNILSIGGWNVHRQRDCRAVRHELRARRVPALDRAARPDGGGFDLRRHRSPSAALDSGPSAACRSGDCGSNDHVDRAPLLESRRDRRHNRHQHGSRSAVVIVSSSTPIASENGGKKIPRSVDACMRWRSLSLKLRRLFLLTFFALCRGMSNEQRGETNPKLRRLRGVANFLVKMFGNPGSNGRNNGECEIQVLYCTSLHLRCASPLCQD